MLCIIGEDLSAQGFVKKMAVREFMCFCVHLWYAGRTLLSGHRKHMSSYSNYRRLEQEVGSRVDADDKQVALLRQLNKVDPESVIRWFESRPLPYLSSAAMAEYVRALVKVDRLDESALLKTLQRGKYWLSQDSYSRYHTSAVCLLL